MTRSPWSTKAQRGSPAILAESPTEPGPGSEEISEELLQRELQEDQSGMAQPAPGPLLEPAQEDHQLMRLQLANPLHHDGSPHGALGKSPQALLELDHRRLDLGDSAGIKDLLQALQQGLGHGGMLAHVSSRRALHRDRGAGAPPCMGDEWIRNALEPQERRSS